MELNTQQIRELLKSFNFRRLFINELGWDNHTSLLEIFIENRAISLNAIAEKKGMVAYLCSASVNEQLPDYAIRRKIEQHVTKTAHEHLIIFTDAEQTIQIWQWVRREPGKPIACREHTLYKTQPGDALIQKLQTISFSLEEEETLTLSEVTRRAKTGFDIERVTKRFYDRFKKEHTAFLQFVKGITEKTDLEWYASVMLNRLMFVYFIQRKGFLDSDPDYLRNRLARMRKEHGHDRFYSFYRYFLLRLFHEGLGGKTRTTELENLLGKIPYFDGGFFEKHPVEQKYKDISIPDEAFERVFDYFDQYQWHLDERPLRKDNEINPDVLGYIFEKYINQKQMGAYYTKEDITEYISKNTVLPFLFDAARSKCKVAFDNPGGPTVWDLLSINPDRYIYQAVKHGVINEDGSVLSETDLPEFVQKGMNDPRERMFNKQYNLDQAPGGDPVRLVTETWREYVIRRNRCLEIREKLKRGEIKEINDLITLNLDIRQFAQDVIENCEGPELLRAFWHTINGHIPEKSHENYQNGITILDPTCGSGAFLFAALNILESLYEACLDRMASFVEDLDRSEEKHRPEKYTDFRKILKQVEEHPNRRYFIFKSIILNNLYGVDIMEEAVEICKLRLFLKLVAQVEPDNKKENLGIEPLPDIDFNIRTGNTLVGYAIADDVKNALKEDSQGQGKLQFGEILSAYQKFEEKVELADDAFKLFRQMQVDPDLKTEDFSNAKQSLRERLKDLDDELNIRLAEEYGININKKDEYDTWLKSHQPFHWFVEFYGIMKDGGFDVIIGNPPYVVNTPSKVAYNIKSDLYKTYPCKNLYAFVYERSIHLSHKISSIGLIIQLTALSSEKMTHLQDLLIKRGMLIAPSFPRRPESIFDGVEMPVTIFISRPSSQGLFTTTINRFYTEERPNAINLMAFQKHDGRLHGHRLGKIGGLIDNAIRLKLLNNESVLESLTTASPYLLYYQEACRYWAKACKGYPYFKRNGENMTPPHGRSITFQSENSCSFAACLINSSLFYWFYSAFSDCEHINDALVRTFQIPKSWNSKDWKTVELDLSDDLEKHTQRKIINTKEGHKIEYDQIDAPKSKRIIDQIDQILAKYYGFTDEELDFIINYDIKYRIGRGADDDSE